MKNIKLTIEYDGTNYLGWQKQNNGKTIQGEIEKAIEKITGEVVDLTGSSRTDSGVHARGMVANFKTESKVPPRAFYKAINTKLPDDIAIVSSEEVEDEFHSRYCSKGKIYSYSIMNTDRKVAIGSNYFLVVKEKLDVRKMKEASSLFVGTHDFSAYKTQGSSVKTSVRTVNSIEIECRDELIKIIVSGEGFLYNMVRIMVGTLIDVGVGRKSIETVKMSLELGERTLAGPVVKAKGLVLEKVFY